MKNNDKVIAAFLVSLGFFSGIQAMEYVGGLSAKEKKSLLSTKTEVISIKGATAGIDAIMMAPVPNENPDPQPKPEETKRSLLA